MAGGKRLTESIRHAALARFGIRPRRIRSLAAAVARVDTADGKTFALRCQPISDRVFGNIPLELDWIAALRRDTEIRPPEPLPGLDGELIQVVTLPGEAERWDCLLFRWIPGPELASRLTPENVQRLGVLSARLHEHATTYRPPPTIEVRMLNELIGRGEREVVLSEKHPLFVPPARRAIFQRVAEGFQRTVDALYAESAGRRVIHADLNHENVKLDRGRSRPLDFYEAIWGYPVQDVALTLYDLRCFARSAASGYLALREAFQRGYASRLPWPETEPGQIDRLVAGRLLRRVNWVLLHETAPFAADPTAVPDPSVLLPFFARMEGDLRALLDSS